MDGLGSTLLGRRVERDDSARLEEGQSWRWWRESQDIFGEAAMATKTTTDTQRIVESERVEGRGKVSNWNGQRRRRSGGSTWRRRGFFSKLLHLLFHSTFNIFAPFFELTRGLLFPNCVIAQPNGVLDSTRANFCSTLPRACVGAGRQHVWSPPQPAPLVISRPTDDINPSFVLQTFAIVKPLSLLAVPLLRARNVCKTQEVGRGLQCMSPI